MAAVVALQAAGQAVLDQPGGAVGALQTMAAGAAERERGVAAPVEKQQNLLAGNQGLADGLAPRRRQPAGAEALPPTRPVLSQVAELDPPQDPIPVTPPQGPRRGATRKKRVQRKSVE